MKLNSFCKKDLNMEYDFLIPFVSNPVCSTINRTADTWGVEYQRDLKSSKWEYMGPQKQGLRTRLSKRFKFQPKMYILFSLLGSLFLTILMWVLKNTSWIFPFQYFNKNVCSFCENVGWEPLISHFQYIYLVLHIIKNHLWSNTAEFCTVEKNYCSKSRISFLCQKCFSFSEQQIICRYLSQYGKARFSMFSVPLVFIINEFGLYWKQKFM